MRNLTKALTVVSLLAPVSGHSLGIGDIKVRSALNQNLNAEIVLVASKGENPSKVKVSLASADKFDEAGIPWTYFLSKIKFNTVVKPNGAMVIKVTSREALKEPYLNFLLEVTWTKGSLYREFTVLVDPPTDYQQSVYQEPVYQEPSYPTPSRYENYPPQQEYAPRPRAVRQSSRPRQSSNGGYGGKVVTRRSDTLWKVASRVRGHGVSVEQMMMSLYEKNPNAFYQENVNALSAGKTLKIPDKSEVQQTSRQAALDEFARHNAAWNSSRSGVPGSRTQVAKEETVDSQLKLEAPVEATVAANENVAPTGEQSTGSQSSGSQTTAPQRQTTGEKENPKTTAAPVDDALQGKVAALEKQMAMMQELIALKDKQLAELQNPAKPSVPTETTPVVPAPPSPVPIEQVPVQNKPEPPPVSVPAAPVLKPAAPVTPVVKPPVRKIIQPKPVVEESGSPFPWIAGGLGVILLPLFGWLWWQKKKIIQEAENESMFRSYSTMRSADSTGPQSSMARKSSTAISGESSFLNDFKASDFESFESFNVEHGDIDPLEEADVYLAYGRYQQAEDLIRQAINNHPERDECKLKLLEIYHASTNKDDFENYAMELAAAGKQEDKEFWRKVMELSRDICPDLPLFAIQIPSTAAVFTAPAEALAETILLRPDASEQVPSRHEPEKPEIRGIASFEVSDEPISESTFEGPHSELLAEHDIKSADAAEARDAVPGSNDEVMSFDLDSFEDSFAGTQDNDMLDFDLGPYPGSEPKEAAVAASESVSKPDGLNLDGTDKPFQLDTADNEPEIEAFEFDFNMDKKEVPAPSPLEEVKEAEAIDSWDPEKTLDFSFDMASEKEIIENNELDFSFDFEPEAVGSTNKASFQGQNFSLSDLTDMDEIETKLDLAKAYIDMGDVDSAKDIIGQVIKKGTEEQKKTAAALLDDLNAG